MPSTTFSMTPTMAPMTEMREERLPAACSLKNGAGSERTRTMPLTVALANPAWPRICMRMTLTRLPDMARASARLHTVDTRPMADRGTE